MSSASTTPIIMVMTARGPARLISEGGSQAWHLNPEKARKYDFVVCVQNRNNGNWGEATEPHLMAFLIGKISSVELSKEPLDPGKPLRYIVKISEYARIAVQAPAWVGRNPVKYADLAYLGIDSLNGLEWHPITVSQAAEKDIEADIGASVEGEVEGDTEPYAPEMPGDEGTGIIQVFRQQLAAAVGVRPSQIHIHIDL